MTMLDFSSGRRTPLILQTEAAECGHACVAMVAGHHGHRIDLASLRARCAVSMKGSTLAELMHLAAALDMEARPLRLELAHLPQLKLPCILHWDFNHFVVLVRARAGSVTLLDPTIGRREVAMDEFSRHFTGVALELTPTHAFKPADERRRVPLRTLLGRLPALAGGFSQVIALALMLQVFALLAPFYMQWVVDEAIVSQDRDLLSVLGVGFLLLAGLQVGLTALRAWVLMVLGATLNLQLMSNLFRHLIRLPMAWFDKRHIGDVVSRFDSLNAIQRTLTTSFLEALIDGVMALGTVAMMFVYSPRLACVALAAALLYALLRIVLYRPFRAASEEQIVRGARQHSHFLETVRGMQGIKLSGREDQRTVAWRNLVVDQFNAMVRTQRLGVLYQSLNGLLFGIENVVTVWIGARLVLDAGAGSGFTVGMLFAFVAYKTQFVQRTAALVEKGMDMRMLNLHTERVSDIALTSPEQDDAQCAASPLAPSFSASFANSPLAASAVGAPLQLQGAIELKDVKFRYADADPMLIDGVSLRVEAGESLAIIGPSGSGKTTLVKLMLGLLQPLSGSIEVDGVPLARVGLSRYRSAVASVMQDDQLFAGSIAENIAFFDPQPDFARIEACARMAEVHDDIAGMPMQYNTLVGDMGTVFSGGQKQRILLARALYRQPRILFLDEATSHLDVARERCVNEAVRQLKLTRVIVAHRSETIASADRVVKLVGGRIVNGMAVARKVAAAAQESDASLAAQA
jgi:ATP-binding cassette subfamily B protein RaxB